MKSVKQFKARGLWFVGDPVDETSALPPDYRIRAYAYGIRIPLRVGKTWRRYHPRKGGRKRTA